MTERARKFLIIALRVALVGVLVVTGWRIYRRVQQTSNGGTNSANETNVSATNQATLIIILRRPSADEAALRATNIEVEIYPLDVGEARTRFNESVPIPGARFEDYLKRQLKNRPPLKRQLDARNQTVVNLAPGDWWIHATLAGAQTLTWRVPVTVNATDAQQIIELTPENAYTKEKRF